MNEKGELVRPWCPATRLLDQRETDRENAAAEAAKRAGMRSRGVPAVGQPPPRRDDFPPLQVSYACIFHPLYQAVRTHCILEVITPAE